MAETNEHKLALYLSFIRAIREGQIEEARKIQTRVRELKNHAIDSRFIAGETFEHRDAVFCEGGRRIGETQAMGLQSSSSVVSKEGPGLYSPRIRLQISDEGVHHTKAAMCRTKTHKFIQRLYEQDELYDLVKDPLEERNIINDPAYADILNALRERMLKWYMETCDVVPQLEDKR